MPGRIADVAAASALALIVTAAIALPVLRAPSQRVFGKEIVGRHHDPFTVMAQLERPITIDMYSQPVTDIPGALLARLSGGVAAYNWLVLLSFPLSAAAAYLLARHLALSSPGATVAAMAYAFSPFHLAHAAYHPHIAQTQWVPLYLLALWRCLDDASPAAVGFLGAATLAVTLSNFYGGLIMAVITPVAVSAYWFFLCRSNARPLRRLGITVGALGLIAACGIVYIFFVAHAIVVDRAVLALPRADLFRYSAKWWSYLVPPVEHPLLGPAARRVWNWVGVREGLLEQQVSLGWGFVVLGLIAVVAWAASARARASSVRQFPPLACVPVLVIVAVTALVCSLSPERAIGRFTFVRPSALLYAIAPMFRAYARFGVVVQLMAALVAGIGVDWILRAGSRPAQILAAALVVVAAGEYVVSPPAMWRDVLPTMAHRWVVNQVDRARVVDCVPLNQESLSVQWLTGDRVTLLGGSINDCTEPNLSQKLAAMGYTHLLLRRDTIDGRWFANHPAPEGLRAAARFDDGEVFAVTARTPAIYTATMTGFFPRERNSEWTWRWMAKDAAWTVVNTRAQPVATTLAVDMAAFHCVRPMDLLLDGRRVQTVVVEPSAHRIHLIGPLTMSSGSHTLGFHSVDAPTSADNAIHNGDRRLLSVAIGTWSWDGPGVQR